MSKPAEPKMTLMEAMKTRRSVRGFLDQPVPDDIIRSVFELAQLSPSNSNIQPWRVYVASGKTLATIRADMVELAESESPVNWDFEYPMRFSDVYRERQVDSAKSLYQAMDIGREDSSGRKEALLRNYRFFNAPHVAFLCMEKEFPQSIAVDLGIYAQSLMLALTAYGIASCPIGAVRNYPQVVREIFGFGETIGVLFGVAFGYEDRDVPANMVRMGRSPVEENVVFRN